VDDTGSTIYVYNKDNLSNFTMKLDNPTSTILSATVSYRYIVLFI